MLSLTLCRNEHIIRTSVKPEKGLVTLKILAIARPRMSQKSLVIFYLTFVLSVFNYSFDLLTVSTAQLNQLEIIQMNQ